MFDWLRLVLALIVVCQHLGGAMHFYALEDAASSLFPVAGFLAISGFMILGSIERSRSIGHFWWKRAIRVLPALLVSFGIAWAFLGSGGLLGSLRTYISGGLWTSVYGTGNNALWSLLWEEVLYAILCVLWLLGAYRDRGLTWFLLLLAAQPLIELQGTPDSLRRISILPIAFLIGNLAYLYQKEIMGWRSKTLLWVGVAVGLLQWTCRVGALAKLGEPLVLGLNVGTLCIACLLIGMRGHARRVKQDWSYGCYVYHVPLLLTGFIWLLPVVCWASYRWVEKPALGLKDIALKKRRIRPAITAEELPSTSEPSHTLR
jgi:peptidoglycan/LPS O-acetylase OafA/YrhL